MTAEGPQTRSCGFNDLLGGALAEEYDPVELSRLMRIIETNDVESMEKILVYAKKNEPDTYRKIAAFTTKYLVPRQVPSPSGVKDSL